MEEGSLEKNLSLLKFIGKIIPGEKIDVQSLSISKPDIPSRAYRTFISRESRIETFDFIKKTLHDAVDLIEIYSSKNNDKIVNSIVNNLEKSKEGLINLTITYKDDRKFISDVETLIETLETKIQSKNKFM